MNHEAEFRRCLLELDVEGIRRLWRHVQPNLPQPKSDHEVLCTIHLARTKMQAISLGGRKYSEDWLRERQVGQTVPVVGIAVKHRLPRSLEIRSAMSEAVVDAIKAGVSLENESDEIRKRILAARAKAL